MTGINKPFFRSVVRSVSEETGVSVATIMGPSIRRKHTQARNAAMLRLSRCGYSLPVIGDFFDRHHTTVLKNIKRLEQRYKK